MSARVKAGGRRTLVLTVASLPRFCQVCSDDRAIRIVVFPGLAMHGGGVVTCPHCSPEPGRSAVPIYLYPLRADRPRQTGGAG